jgi:phosphoglycerate dehydrogenase-like enzyme
MKVVFAGTFAGLLIPPIKERLSVPCEIVARDEATVTDDLADTDVLVSMSYTHAMADAAPNLKLVQVAGAGLDRIDRSALRPDTQLANVYGHEAGIAEFVIGAMIALTRKTAHLDQQLRRGHWESQWAVGRPTPPLMPELAGKTLLILGYGHIGEAIARRAVAFDMRIRAIRRKIGGTQPPLVEQMATLDAIDDILGAADFVAVTLPLSDRTRGLLDADRFRRMKPTAYLINVARGEIADEQALYDALVHKRIAGAALDVWYRYPTGPGPTLPSALPFHELDNVIMSPHASGWTEGMLAARARVIAENIERTARGERPLHAIEPSPAC